MKATTVFAFLAGLAVTNAAVVPASAPEPALAADTSRGVADVEPVLAPLPEEFTPGLSKKLESRAPVTIDPNFRGPRVTVTMCYGYDYGWPCDNWDVGRSNYCDK